MDPLGRLVSRCRELGYTDDTGALAVPGADPSLLSRQFVLHDEADSVLDGKNRRSALVTGFGPTNAPSLATLSIILKAKMLSDALGMRTDLVISDLGAWNSRQHAWNDIQMTTARYLKFLSQLGFNSERTTIRSHGNLRLLTVAGILSKVIHEDDVRSEREFTDRLYDELGLRDHFLAISQDVLYTIADICVPLFDGCENVLVMCGLEEHYFVRLARRAVSRLLSIPLGDFIPDGARIGGLYAALIPGLSGYPKMSKSIPASGVYLGEIKHRSDRLTTIDDASLINLSVQCSGWSHEELGARLRADASALRSAFLREIGKYDTLWSETQKAVSQNGTQEERGSDLIQAIRGV